MVAMEQRGKGEPDYQSLRELYRPHVESFDYFIDAGLEIAFMNIKPVEISESSTGTKLRIWLGKPELQSPERDGGRKALREPLFPYECRQSGGSYRGKFTSEVYFQYNDGAVIRETISLGYLPIMLMSKLCHLRGADPKKLVFRTEEATEMGGYFICNGLERLCRLLILPKRNHPMALIRKSFCSRGDGYTDKAVVIRCVREDQSAVSVKLYYLQNGSARLGFWIQGREYLLPVGIVLKFFPLLLKLIAWNGERHLLDPTDDSHHPVSFFPRYLPFRANVPKSSRFNNVLETLFSNILPGMMSPGSFLPLLPSLVDLPILVVALEKVERNSGTLVGSSIATIQKSKAPEMLLALMDEAYTGTTIKDRGAGSGSDDSDSIDVADSLFLDLLKDENDGLAARHWTSPDMDAALQASFNARQSDRFRQALRMTPHFLDVYFGVALRDVSDSLVCALIPLLMSRNSKLFPDKIFAFEVRKRFLEFILDSFQRWPEIIALLKKPIVDRLSEAYGTPEKTELALHLCWAIGEHGGGGISHKDTAQELFESLELLLYENISSSQLGLYREPNLGMNELSAWKSSQSRLLCFVVTAIAKLATSHRELLPRARVSLSKVARSQSLNKIVWRRASDYLGLMDEPAICQSVLGPQTGKENVPGVVKWSLADSQMITHIPFYLLGEHEGPPFFDFSFSDIM